jgi:hypothetical protein
MDMENDMGEGDMGMWKSSEATKSYPSSSQADFTPGKGPVRRGEAGPFGEIREERERSKRK